MYQKSCSSIKQELLIRSSAWCLSIEWYQQNITTSIVTQLALLCEKFYFCWVTNRILRFTQARFGIRTFILQVHCIDKRYLGSLTNDSLHGSLFMYIKRVRKVIWVAHVPFSVSASKSDGSASSLRSTRNLRTWETNEERKELERERFLGIQLTLFTVMVSMATRDRKVIITSCGYIPVVSQKVFGSLQTQNNEYWMLELAYHRNFAFSELNFCVVIFLSLRLQTMIDVLFVVHRKFFTCLILVNVRDQWQMF